MSPARLLALATCLTGLALAHHALALPGDHRLALQADTLTAHEQRCYLDGLHVLFRAEERDEGWSVTDSLRYSRHLATLTGTTAPVMAQRDRLTHLVYAKGHLTPARLRQLAELACLADDPSKPNLTDYRQY
jgi:hypothetical protein